MKEEDLIKDLNNFEIQIKKTVTVIKENKCQLDLLLLLSSNLQNTYVETNNDFIKAFSSGDIDDKILNKLMKKSSDIYFSNDKKILEMCTCKLK